MKNKKNNAMFTILIIFLIAVILGITGFGITTWARYRSRDQGNVVAEIAKWSFKVNDSTEKFADINLADTIHYDHVVDTTIAPGTQGAFDLIIDGNGSEVSIDYYVDIDVTNKPTNMKFYSDPGYTKEITITDNNKIELENEILLANIKKPVTETIYWKWEYRTAQIPTDEVATEYGIDKTKLLSDYNSATTDEEKKNILMKANDIIDTQEAGNEIILPVKVKGIQKYPEGLKVKMLSITSPTDIDYIEGDEVTFTIEFTESVYGDNKKGEITSDTAPIIKAVFEEESTTASNPIAVVASVINSNIRFAEGEEEEEQQEPIERTATFVNAERDKINYSYIIQEGDVGTFKIQDVTGIVYSKGGQSIELEKQDITGDTIVAIETTETGKLADCVKVGDYVNYNAGNQSIGSTGYLGVTLTGTMNTNEVTKWRVLSKNRQTGIVELMAEEPTTTQVTIQSINGYRYSEEALNKVCAIFGKGSGATGARSINEKDVMQYSNFNPKTQYRNIDVTPSVTIGGTRTYTSGTFLKLEKYMENETERDVVTGGIELSNGYVMASEENPVTIIQTYYNTINDETTEVSYTGVNGSIIYKMLFKKAEDENEYKNIYWLANRCVKLKSNECDFCVRCVSPDKSNSGANVEYGVTNSCVPVVSLNGNLTTSGKDSNGVWQLN